MGIHGNYGTTKRDTDEEDEGKKNHKWSAIRSHFLFIWEMVMGMEIEKQTFTFLFVVLPADMFLAGDQSSTHSLSRWLECLFRLWFVEVHQLS